MTTQLPVDDTKTSNIDFRRIADVDIIWDAGSVHIRPFQVSSLLRCKKVTEIITEKHDGTSAGRRQALEKALMRYEANCTS